MEVPDFSLSVTPVPILITGKKNTVFSLTPNNFDEDEIRDYEIIWKINPPLSNVRASSVLSFGRLMQVTRGNWQPNTFYTISTKVTYKSLPRLSTTEIVEFETQAPPANGTVVAEPMRGTIGTPFTIVCRNWESDNKPIVYNVYQTNNVQGTRRGRIVNQDGPIEINSLF